MSRGEAKKNSVTKALVCDKCGVEVTKAKVRRERMGSHSSWPPRYLTSGTFKGIPSRMGLVLDISPRTSGKSFVFLATLIVTDPGNTEFAYKKKY